MSALARKPLFDQRSLGVIIDRAGLPVDASGPVWSLNNFRILTYLSWITIPIYSEEIVYITKCYIAELIKTKSPDLVRNTFETLYLLERSNIFRSADLSGDEIPATFFEELRLVLDDDAAWRLHYIRHWYMACADMGCERFSPEVSFELDSKRIGGNRKGHAVLSADPEEGPLDDLEIMGLLVSLNAGKGRSDVDLDGIAALWLCIAFGSNPSQIALLREEDVKTVDVDGTSFVHIQMPRIKKRSDRPRSDFRLRKLEPEVADVILDLIERNRRERALLGWSERHAFPLFVRPSVRPSEEDDPLFEYGRHLFPGEVTALVASAVSRLGVMSIRSGAPLRVSCRRLRYTFATRLVREGASRQALAEALDHTDLQNVGVYFDVRSDIVKSLDKAMALALGPVAQGFMGTLVSSELQAQRGDDPRSRIRFRDRSTGEAEAVGTCGQYSFCGLLAPIACYTCNQFQPWMDGPHDRILGDLLAERERRAAAGQDGRMVTLHDATLLAIGDVIARIADARENASA